MALKSGFFNSVNHDRKYSSEDFSRFVNALVTDGIVTTKGEQFMTIPGEGLSVNVKSGFAWFNSTWSMSEDITPLILDPADVTRARIDAIVIDIDHTNEVRDNRLMVVKGTPAVTPLKPVLANDEKHHQHALAYVSIPAAATSITAANIDIRVGHDDCPFATGKLDVISVDVLFDAWEAEFQEWFNNLKAQLGDNIVTNLQQQIDDRVKVSDKATKEDISSGTPNKWVDAASMSTVNEVSNRASLLLNSTEGFIMPGSIYKTDNPLYIYDIPWVIKTYTSYDTFNWSLDFADEEGNVWKLGRTSDKTQLAVLKFSVTGEKLIDIQLPSIADSQNNNRIIAVRNGYLYWTTWSDVNNPVNIHFIDLNTSTDNVQSFLALGSTNMLVYYLDFDENNRPSYIYMARRMGTLNVDAYVSLYKKSVSGTVTHIADTSRTNANDWPQALYIKDSHILFVEPPTSTSTSTILNEIDTQTGNVKTVRDINGYITFYENSVSRCQTLGNKVDWPIGEKYLNDGNGGRQSIIYRAGKSTSIIDSMLKINLIYINTTNRSETAGNNASVCLINNRPVGLMLNSYGAYRKAIYIPEAASMIIMEKPVCHPYSAQMSYNMKSILYPNNNNYDYSFDATRFRNIFTYISNNNIYVLTVLPNCDVAPMFSTKSEVSFLNFLGTGAKIVEA